ncbi:MAG TPA: valine--tRNA ligase [Thermoanaerobaculia bacterium]|nr:valine--tRNA ligase [Thermoanaerobaculia bacterium]
MEKQFDPKSFEPRWREHWRGLFAAEAPSERSSFVIMIPPPNVTGKLHIGHALQTALQDLLTRWKRMQGYNALWLPGTDHAGIATQLMVERQLESEGTSREELGRERFLERMWAWTAQYGDNIRQQLERLGASCDWSRERFTLDEGLSRAVREAFVRLHEEGLIYRGEYMVNWSPVLDTAISDLEVETRTVQGKLYYVAYPVEDPDRAGAEPERVVVATTRPETMLGDTAVAFAPGDPHYAHLEGRHAVLPLVGRRIPFVADPAVEAEFGTGLVKVTPSHDPADFEIARRHGLPAIQVIDRRGRMTEAAGEELAGLDRFEARQKVVDRLREGGHLVKVEDYVHNVGFSDRSGEPVEPLVSTQWFCDVSGMAERALEAVRSGALTLVPPTYEKTWEHWLANVKPWCVSRQLWWGHRIPAWYAPDGRVVVARSEEAAAEKAGTRELRQDPDVLDTWFSSGLWPFSTLGWPEETEDLRTFYPTDVLVTAHDILFFWVARMVMMGYHLTDRSPFHTCHLTGLVRDAEGQKMSKTKGNAVDPLELVEEYGADAVRFTLTILDSPGRDIPLDPERMAGYRAFGNKIWNATRFALTRLEGSDARVLPELGPEGLAAPERWILSRLSRSAEEVSERFAALRFDEACNRLYHFFWGELCDWYIELAKPPLLGRQSADERPRVGEVLLSVLDRSLRLLHPVMPFLTEELWHRLPGREAIHPQTIALAPYPERRPDWEDADVEARMGALIDAVTRVRSLAAELGVRRGQDLSVHLWAEPDGDPGLAAFLEEQKTVLEWLCPTGDGGAVELSPAPAGASRDLVAGVNLGLVALAREPGAEERERLVGELGKLEAEIGRTRERLANRQFLDKAPPEIVEGNRRRLAELEERRERLAAGRGAR